jgi:tetratricopeptide (TPR) repeat protein
LAAVASVTALLLLAASPDTEEQLWRHRNLGKALFENPTSVAQAPAEFEKALALAPDSFRDRLNYGLALLRSGEIEKSIPVLERAQAQNPKLPHTWFNLGIANKRLMRYREAIRQFEGMIRLVPDEPVAHHNLALLYSLTGRSADALKEFETAAKLDPRFVAPRFQIYNYYRLNGDEAKAARALAEFRRVKEEQQAADESEDVEWCFYAELYDPATSHPVLRDNSPPVPVRFDDRRLPGTVDPETAGIAAVDFDNDGSPGLIAWSRNGIRLYRRGLEPVADSGLGDLKDVIGLAQGDFDNDAFPDLCVLTARGPRLYRNHNGRFEEFAAKLPQSRFDSAIWLDFDHDYDLDLFLFGAKSMLLRNIGPGGFEDYTPHFPFVPGHALAAVSLRVIPDTKGLDLAVSYADHGGALYRDRLRGVFESTPFDAIPPRASSLTAVDLDNDAWMDLAFDTPEGVSFAVNRDGRFTRQTTGLSGAFALADTANRGFTDLIGGGALRRNLARFQFAKPENVGLPDAEAWTWADFDGDGREDLGAVARDGSIHVLLNRTGSKNQHLNVVLEGVKNLKRGTDTEVEVKAGDLYQKQMYRGVPLTFGLGSHKLIDTVRITWPNALIQNEPNQPVNRTAKYKEAPRLAGSCPMVFAWNGHSFQFITDVLGVAPLGASAGDGNYFPVDHKEYVRIPENTLALKDGRYEIRITEELHEVSYLDQVRLIAVDHPAGIRVYTNDKFKSPPFPDFRLYGVRARISPVHARDGAGHNLLPRVLHQDGVYASGFRHNAAGVAELHSLDLDFGPEAAPGNKAVLFLSGWVDWADGSTFYGAAQAGNTGLIFPYLQVKDSNGAWRTVVEDMGIPAGKPKTIAVDLTGKFLSGSREVRIVTNLCVYWDQIFLSDAVAQPPVRLTPLDAESADLRLRGFSTPEIDPRREEPEVFNYNRWTPNASWNQTPGLYTRYGDVRELALSVDDRLIIMGSGDELRLTYDGRSLPPLPGGWRRDFLLRVDGWAKDADANTAFSQTVEPLPFHGMSRYPYPPNEHFPEDPAHREYRKKYNTRPAMKFVPRLVTRR